MYGPWPTTCILPVITYQDIKSKNTRISDPSCHRGFNQGVLIKEFYEGLFYQDTSLIRLFTVYDSSEEVLH